MKICINIEGGFLDYNESFERLIDWHLPVIPRVGEGIFIDDLIKDLPEQLEGGHLWYIWSVDWRHFNGIGICPVLWIQHWESER